MELEKIIKQSNKNLEDLTTSELDLLGTELASLSLYYNIPGISHTEHLALESGDNFAVISGVGGNILSLELGGESIYTPGRDPFVMPYINSDGELKLLSPLFYRDLGHHVVPVANQFPGFDKKTHTQIEGLVEQKVRRDYNTGHHGISQCRVGNISYQGDRIRYSIEHLPDDTNLFPLNEQMNCYFEGDWFVDEIILENPNDFPIPVSLLRHPYFILPIKSFDHGSVSILGNGGKRKLFNLHDYPQKVKNRYEGLPLSKYGESLIFDRGDGVSLEIMFEGDYEKNCGLQLFSNGSTLEKLQEDYIGKHELHARRLGASAELMGKLGFDTGWYDGQGILEERELHADMLAYHRLICIEDNTSTGNIYSDGFDNAVILEPLQSKRYIRKTRRLS